MKVLVVDNVDSFTFTLVDYLRHAGAEVYVARADSLTVGEALAHDGGILIGPGPGHPAEAGISVELASACIRARRPLLGICLGHQAIGLACGASVVRAAPMHGKTDQIHHDGSGLFEGLPSPLIATRYHSLVIEGLPCDLEAMAFGGDGSIQAVRHRLAPVHGIQFHPESILSDRGHDMLRAFVLQAGGPRAPS